MPLALPKKNEQVFQLTLTELAFTLVFLLLLLSGWMVLDEKRNADEKDKQLNQIKEQQAKDAQAIAESKNLKEEAEQALGTLKSALSKEAGDPNAIISDLRKCSAKEAENQQLKVKLAQLDEKLTALVAVSDVISKIQGNEQNPAIKAEIESALAFKKAFEQAKKNPLRAGDAVARGRECADADASLAGLNKEAQNLRGQLKNMIRRAESSKNLKGFGLPPCWVDEGGKVQRLIQVDVTDRGLIVHSGWPAIRDDDAKKLPNIDALIATDHEQSIATFRTNVMPIFQWSRKQDPECRHYASIVVSATKVTASVPGDNAVNDYFYPFGKVSLSSGK